MIIKFIVNYIALVLMLAIFAIICALLIPFAICIPFADKKTWIEFTDRWPWELEKKPMVPWAGYDLY